MKENILMIEDEENIRDILNYSLKNEGYSIKEASTGEEGIEIIENINIDLIILDLMLPGISGYDVCREINPNYKIPIIMLTAKNDIVDKVIGLELGADDYITKPFDIREVIARVKVCLRRIKELDKQSHPDNHEKSEENIIQITDDIKIFVNSREVFKDQKIINLKPKEYDLLYFLARNKNIVFSRNQLLDDIWGYDFLGDSRTVDVHIQRIRKKLGVTGKNSIIKTVFGVGYKMI
ncbi:response regulator transcription factor [Clostridium botulinum]|uniref:Stage 0 sporulation protein A homolog n=1 Tax=Clostridium botulinum C/D str. DC5 TaxID=1443128 RepID=A0A0A0IGC7_CLOBO|nr:response regulator transcription factor [Clostridium botulinum]KGN00540.1 XRE family transcriptional regulator [Clostridium botulinum C/D str. DC5]KOC51920.1 XRE family transcriptional regulator [Clostridium botulinum]KOC55092.1 XRE family transcriptional regulator [Clostridium botulinum]MCD3234998.1 response regulator transcription factor [Clostridium botulinum D/C]MCD3240876.1 response regulator transcription factor [Clostridium botulinum D/C]